MCDCLVALAPATAGGVTLFAKSSDRPPHEPQDVGYEAPRRDRGPRRVTHIEVEPAVGDTLACLLSRPRWCWGAEHGLNEAGVAIGNEAIYTTLDPRSVPPALIGMDLVRLGLERASSAPAAVEAMIGLLERYGQGGSGHDGVERPYWSSFLVADPQRAFVIETSGRSWAVEEVGTEGRAPVRAISNRTTIPAFDAEHRHPRQPVGTLVDPRLRASEAMLAAGPVSLDALRGHQRAHVGGDGGWTVCMHVEGVEVTTAAMVAELPVGQPPRGWFSLGSPCRSVYVPLLVESTDGFPPWEHFAAPSAAAPAPEERLVALQAALDGCTCNDQAIQVLTAASAAAD